MTDLPVQEPRKSRKGVALAVGGVVLAAAAIGGGVWGYNAFYGQGDQPAEALPVDGLLGYVAVDLAPNGEQLLAARSTLEKFPAVADEIELGGKGDLRKELFAKLQEDGTCTKIDWDEQVGSWLGDRIGVAIMDAGAGKEPEGLLVFQTTDKDKAEKHLDAVQTCLNEGSAKDSRIESHVFVDDWLVFGEGQLAEGLDKKIEDKGSLADDEQFSTWTDAAGDPGVLTGFATPLGYRRMIDFVVDDTDVTLPKAVQENIDKELDRFEGVGIVGRFRDGGLEVEGASSAEGLKVATGAGESIASLPESTVAAFGFSLLDGWMDELIDVYGPIFEEEMGMTVEKAEEELTGMTGLDLDDLESLLGDAVVIAVDSDIDGDAVQQNDPSALPVGIKIKGDPDAIEDAIEKIRDAGAKMGMPRGYIVSEESDGYVVVSLSPKYADKLADESGLGATTSFRELVPESSEAISAFFLDFDSEQWLDDLLSDFDAPKEVRENVAPLRGIGMSSWKDDDEAHVLFKLATGPSGKKA